MFDTIRKILGVYPEAKIWCVRCSDKTLSWRNGYKEMETRGGKRTRITGTCKDCGADTSQFVAMELQ